MIGILDSGVGGLSIYAEVKRRHPGVAVVYLADKKHFPYGEKTDAELVDIVRTAVKTLISNGANIAVLGCNSATVSTVCKLREEYSIQFIGIEPAVKQAATATKNGKIGVLATQRTTMDHEGESLAPDCTLCKSHNEALVAMIEHDYTRITDEMLHEAMSPFVKTGVDTLVLGCTHYHFLKKRLEALYPKINFLEPTEAVVNHFESVVSDNNIEMDAGNDIFLCSADKPGFEKSLMNLLGIRNADVREI